MIIPNLLRRSAFKSNRRCCGHRNRDPARFAHPDQPEVAFIDAQSPSVTCVPRPYVIGVFHPEKHCGSATSKTVIGYVSAPTVRAQYDHPARFTAHNGQRAGYWCRLHRCCAGLRVCRRGRGRCLQSKFIHFSATVIGNQQPGVTWFRKQRHRIQNVPYWRRGPPLAPI